MNSNQIEKSKSVIKVIENTMSPRFGHTITLVHKTKAVLFGGATGVDGKFSINSDTFVYFIESKQWLKLERTFLIQQSEVFQVHELRTLHVV